MEHIIRLYHYLIALLAVLYYGYPARKLTVIAVTGTSGKTTTSHLIYDLLKNAGERVSLISTVKAIIGGKEYETGFHVTTPNPFAMQKFLKMVLQSKGKYVVIEASSHGIAQFRMLGTNVCIAVLTNIAHEHLDFHKTFKAYADAKLSLIINSKIAVVNKDDSSYQMLVNSDSHRVKLLTYSLKSDKADFSPKNIPTQGVLPGDFNKENMLAAGAVGTILGVKKGKIKNTFQRFTGVTGRFEKIINRRGLTIIVDFAHKPNALEKLLDTFQKMKHKRVIIVFGCAGERDKGKRRMMGEIAGRKADVTILTAEDPRSEDVNEIIAEIVKGCKKAGAKEGIKNGKSHYFVRVPDRQQAIDYALNKVAKKGDIVAFLGKSHEKSMCFGKTEYPWSEYDAIHKALAKS